MLRSAVVQREPFGSTPVGEAERVVLRGRRTELAVTTLGATVEALRVADADGGWRDLVLGLPSAGAAWADDYYVGAVVGRYANRIAGGRLVVDGRACELPTNDGPHTLHGGPDGFHRRLWRLVAVGPDGEGRPRIDLELVSPDGDMGFPGSLTARARYTVVEAGVQLELSATTDAPTVVNLTQHAYWNLSGAVDVRDHSLQVAASRYLPVGADGIPTGPPAGVADDGMDLRVLGPLRRVREGVIDHTFVLDDLGLDQVAARLCDRPEGWTLEVSTDAPSVQVYTGGKLGGTFQRHQGVCLETQWLPDSPNHPHDEGWPSTLLVPGEVWSSTTVWRVRPPVDR